VLNCVKYVSYFEATVYQGPAHLYNYSAKSCLHCNHLTLIHHVKCI